MRTLHSYHVIPSLPDRIKCLNELAHNLRWAWDHDTIELFRRLDRNLWESSGHNPVLLLGTVDQKRLDEVAVDEAFLMSMDRVYQEFQNYMMRPGWCMKAYGELKDCMVAYFSAEFGLTECVPNYAGGLGILAGDHLKSASDLGVPLAGVGLLYQQGYFRQYLNVDGWQQETYPQNDFYNLPVQPVLRQERPLLVSVDFPGRTVHAKVWRLQVGRVPLFLLDTNIPENAPEDRGITDALYGGDKETRIQQEIILGIGGIRALMTLGMEPTVCHMNEGHSAFLALERARLFMQSQRVSYREARQATCAGNLFTTHTPVPAGFDLFDIGLMQKYFQPYAASLGLTFDQFMAFGRYSVHNTAEPLNMAVLASKHSSYTNGVSRLHGEVTRRMVREVWSRFSEHEIPVGHVTNGVHTRSWISLEMADLLRRYLGPRWLEDPSNLAAWERIGDIPDEELWRTHERRKERLVAFVRRRLVAQLKRRGASDPQLIQARSVLNSDVLTIGFARRFATYKRATLLLRDPERLKRILSHDQRPVQLLFAGKAHPRDQEGKELIRELVHFTREESVRRRVVFLEDYDMAVARYLVQGVDVWLNTPRRPLEASGTSGMKVLANGGLNLSILDGWWCEGYESQTGWAIGSGEEYSDLEYQDRVECDALFNLLEEEVVPLYYDRTSDDLPRAWIAKMKESMKRLCPRFNTNRMVAEYTERFYVPAARRYRRLVENGAERAKALVQWRTRMYRYWKEVRVEEVANEHPENVLLGTNLNVTARVRLGAIPPEDVAVQLYHGGLDTNGRLQQGESTPMTLRKAVGEGTYIYEGEVPCQKSGRCGFTVRVLPAHPDALVPYECPLVAWEGD
ncbi:MAG: alpha-glucan family phosphorylase [Acidobacteriota bacterium]